MQQVSLGTSGRTTSRMGYGCTSIMGGLGRSASLRMLEAAFDAGIRHFDTAPLYGFGESEVCVGEFLARHRGQTTITTKFGLTPEAPNALKSAARTMIRPLIPVVRAMRPKREVAPEMPPVPVKGRDPKREALRAADLRESIGRSLKRLRVERIDVMLLHEAQPIDVQNNEELLRVLQDAVARGDIGTFGIGSERHLTEEIYKVDPAYCPVVEFGWSILDAPVAAWPSFGIFHRVLRGAYSVLRPYLALNPEVQRAWSEELGLDLGQGNVLPDLILAGAYVLNPGSILLVSSKQPRRMAQNVAAVERPEYAAPARRLYELVRSDERLRPWTGQSE